MDKMREEFEAWASNKGLDVDHICIDGDFKCYCFADTHGAFEIWKASRAAMCVELPCGYIDHPYRFDILSAIDDCRLALEDAGVEYK